MPKPPITFGEELWVRRDATRGGSFLARELYVVFYTFIVFIFMPWVLISLVTFEWNAPWEIVHISYARAIHIALIAIPCLSMFTIVLWNWLRIVKQSRYCPIWYHAEQLNPERLTIYHLRASPSIVHLRSSKLTEKKGRRTFKHLTTIRITDATTHDTVILPNLTPDERDRLMEYWRAANN